MKKRNFRWQLALYDLLVLLAVDLLLLVFYRSNEELSLGACLMHGSISFVCIFAARILGSIYQQIWRYGGIQCYIRLLLVDAVAFAATLAIELTLPLFVPIEKVTFSRLLSIASMNLLGALAIRMIYRYCFKCGTADTAYGKFLRLLLRIFAGDELIHPNREAAHKIKIAIIGAGRVGVTLAEELLSNPASNFLPRCFIDVSQEKAGREIHGLPVLLEDDTTLDALRSHEVQEVVFAIPNLSDEKKRELYAAYSDAGYKIKVYDYPMMQTAGGKRYVRDFDIEELLFRKPIVIADEKTGAFYRDKVILITGGGGSIGSELCRQLAKMEPKQIIILDIYENGAYDIQQELKIAYGSKLDLQLEICSVTHRKSLERVFSTYHPQIVIHAAAHKHVPLMEKNCIEAVYNNVFGTKTLVELCEEHAVERFMMVSTDKAVNPTSVMGATKRLAEMYVQSLGEALLKKSGKGATVFITTRFGNVLGSAGSVIPLFKEQIRKGGPVTVTHPEMIRYFMTIPEACRLILQANAMGQGGEIFVFDMGEQVRIVELAKKMIRLAGLSPLKDIRIVFTGLRPGEKLYEELLADYEHTLETSHQRIRIFQTRKYDMSELKEAFEELVRHAEAHHLEDTIRAMKQLIPEYKSNNSPYAKYDYLDLKKPLTI